MIIRIHKNSKRLNMFTRLTLAVASMCSPSLCLADDLPSSEVLIAKMIEAEGGTAAKRKIKNRAVTLTIDFGMGGMIGKGKILSSRPGKMYTTIDIQGMGSFEEGVTDGVAWGMAMITGPQIKEGNERNMALWEANFDGLLEWKSHFKKIECVNKELHNGKEYYKVEFTPLEGDVITTYVDTKKYLPHRSNLKLSTAMGDFEMTIYSEDYRTVDGLVYAHKSRIEIMGQTRVITLDSIKHNIDIPKDRFKLPDDIKALVAKNKEDKKDKEKD